MKKLFLLILIVLLVIFLTGCLPDISMDQQESQAGFFLGIWHGWIAPVSLIASIFNKNITIFEYNNTGFWYGFGFYIAILGGFGGLSLVRKKRPWKHRDNE
ncbi:MAG: hypothetical protein HQ557_07455 [Bacteroidetes bacterium]|nr:hypothetical protein [Bacteroidota bacterium]